MRKGKAAGASMSSLLVPPSQSASGKRPGSQRLAGVSPNPQSTKRAQRTTGGSRNDKSAGIKTSTLGGAARAANKSTLVNKTIDERSSAAAAGGSSGGLKHNSSSSGLPAAKKAARVSVKKF